VTAVAVCVPVFWIARARVLWAIEKSLSFLNGKSKSYKSNAYLLGNCAPVHTEIFQEALEVEGTIPPELSGVFARVGPNPQHMPTGGYHWFDGDGMVHACRIKNGTVSFCNRYVQTSRFKQEKALGWPAFMKIGDMTGVSGLFLILFKVLKKKLRVISEADGSQNANTQLVCDSLGRLLALNEGDLPYQLRFVCEGLLETVGRIKFERDVGAKFTAHPKTDSATGHLHFFGYSVDKPPFCTYSVMDNNGEIIKTMPVNLPHPVMMHDFAMTENHVIFIVCPLVFDPKVMIAEGTLPFKFMPEKGTQIAVLRKDAPEKAEPMWFSLPAFMLFHVANSWEEGGCVHLYAPHLASFNLSLDQNLELEKPLMHHTVLNMKSGEASTKCVTNTAGDFPQVSSGLMGKKCRYAYLACMGKGHSYPPMFRGVAKMDMSVPEGEKTTELNVGQIDFGSDKAGGEVIFVPRIGGAHQEGSNLGELRTKEDDGFLLTFVHDEANNKSEMNIYDARTMSSTPLASVKMPQRVPYGFHSAFINEKQFKAQLKA